MMKKMAPRGRALTNEELKGALGGVNAPPPSGDNGSGQQTNARAVVIDTGDA